MAPTLDKLHEYSTGAITVRWSKARCIHAAECVRQLPAVFEPGRRPWIVLTEGETEEIATIVQRCPSGALHFERHDGGANETPMEQNLALISRRGPLFVRGRVEVVREDGETIVSDTRVALCRCGASKNKPFCDNSHLAVGFADAGAIAAGGAIAADTNASAPLRIVACENGPLKFTGPLAVVSADTQQIRECDRGSLCRCGGSKTKPWCDGTHKTNGFVSG